MVCIFAHDLYEGTADAHRGDQDEFLLEYRYKQRLEGNLVGPQKDTGWVVFLVDGQVAHDESPQEAEMDFFDGHAALEVFLGLGNGESLELDGQKDVLDIKIKEICQDKNRQETVDCLARPVHGGSTRFACSPLKRRTTLSERSEAKGYLRV